MNNTTPAAIFASFESGVASLTPSGGTSVGIKSAYAVIDDDGYMGDPELLSESELDRQFMFEWMQPQDLDIEGQSTSNEVNAVFDLVIGHQVGHYTDCRDRMALDNQQIIAQIIRVNNKPAGVHRTWFEGSETTLMKEGTCFWSTLRFGIRYSVAANYGG